MLAVATATTLVIGALLAVRVRRIVREFNGLMEHIAARERSPSESRGAGRFALPDKTSSSQ